jgi:subtilisin family serine protease
VLFPSRPFRIDAWYTQKRSEGIAVEQAIALLEANPNVEYAEPNYIRSITALSSTSPELVDLWALQNTAQTVNGILGTLDADTDALEAWSIATGTDVIVAVIDTGVDYTHPDLLSSMWDGSACVDEDGDPLGDCIHGYDFEYDDLDPMATTSVGDGAHGTHVAGIIAAAHNDVGVAGIAPGVKIMALRFGLDTASEVRAIDFATRNGAKIINASFGGTASSTAEYEAIQRFQNAGGIFVASAGNSTYDLDTDPTDVYPAEYDLASIISVAATDQDDELAYYSNYGATNVDLGAPGSNILSTVPTSDSVDGYEYKSGTSMAAPMVSGAVALAWSYQSSLSATEVKAAVLDSGDALAVLATTTVSGKRLNVHSMLLSLAPIIPAPDTTAPVITLLGANPLALTVGDVFTDPGAEVTDDTDATTTITGVGTVDTATAGTYVRSYTASDAAGNFAATTTRSVVVSAPAVSSGGEVAVARHAVAVVEVEEAHPQLLRV